MRNNQENPNKPQNQQPGQNRKNRKEDESSVGRNESGAGQGRDKERY